MGDLVALFMHMLVFLKCIAKDKLGNSKIYIHYYTYICIYNINKIYNLYVSIFTNRDPSINKKYYFDDNYSYRPVNLELEYTLESSGQLEREKELYREMGRENIRIN